MNRILKTAVMVILMLIGFSSVTLAVRIKDIAEIQGVRSNQLIGYGLVVGLNGTGDDQKIMPTIQSVATMLTRMGVFTRADVNKIKVSNVAAVIVTAEMPPFSKLGTKIDVTVSSLGNAKNLAGGILLMTPLKGVDSKIYALAQGAVMTGGFSFAGKAASVQKNHPTTGSIPNGAVVEKEIPNNFSKKVVISLLLKNPDFTTAARVSRVLNQNLGGKFATAKDGGVIQLNIPTHYKERKVEFLAAIERFDVVPDQRAKIVINERTGTIIIGENVRISTVAISHGSLSITIRESGQVSQPSAFSQGGQTTVVPQSDITAKEEKVRLQVVPEGVRINEVVQALNVLGVTPRDLMAILQAIKKAGALQAELELM